MQNEQAPNITPELLSDYSKAAICNAQDLIAEAKLLLSHKHYARAYFLSVSSIEEVGKALLSFDSQNRNLFDQAVRSKLKNNFTDHIKKIQYALCIWGANSADPQSALEKALDLILSLHSGRQPSLYTDLRSNPDRVQLPSNVVRAKASEDCVRLADHCLMYAQKHLREKSPQQFSVAHNRLFVTKEAKFRDILRSEDFWLYALSEMEGGLHDIAEIFLRYEQAYSKPGKSYDPK